MEMSTQTSSVFKPVIEEPAAGIYSYLTGTRGGVASCCACAGGLVGGSAGGTVGTVAGVVVGVVPAVFTFGLSIPFGAAVGLCVGTTAGVCAGVATGGTAGLVGFTYRKQLAAAGATIQHGAREAKNQLVLITRLNGRIVELSFLYVPLVPLGVGALAADRVGLRVNKRLVSMDAKDYTDAWLELLLSHIQASGPVFVKLAQWATTRPDIIPDSVCKALKSLQDHTDPHSLEHTHRILDASFSREEWFQTFLIEPEPIGSGCIAQVYRGIAHIAEAPDVETPACNVGAILKLFKSGRRQPTVVGRTRTSSFRARQIAVKVIHPQVRRAVDLDLKFLQAAAWVVDRLGFEGLGVSLALRQFSEFIRIQADFTCEARNLARFKEHFKNSSDDIVIPKVLESWVSRDVVVMSFEDGEPLKTLMEARNEAAGMNKAKKEAWRQIVDAFWAMVFKHRLVHGDMHPGNVLWQMKADGGVRLVLIDCGLAVDLTGDAGADLSMMVKAFLTQQPEDVARLLMTLGERVGGRPEDIKDPEGFVKGIAALIVEANECAFKLSKLNAGALMGRSLILGRKHHVRFDARFVNLMVAMMVLQGVAMSLNPDGDFLSRMHPFVLKAAIKGSIGS